MINDDIVEKDHYLDADHDVRLGFLTDIIHNETNNPIACNEYVWWLGWRCWVTLKSLEFCTLVHIYILLGFEISEFGIVLYMRYNKAKSFNSIIAFWAMVRSKSLRALSMFELE